MQTNNLLARGKRLLAILVPVFVFVALVVVGRRIPPPSPTDDALGATPDAPSTAPSDAPPDASSSASPSASTDASIDTPRLAVEVLADGGFVVDLNLADEDDLVRLPAIGLTRARAILALRAKLGRFKNVDELARIKGIGRSTLRKLRPHVRV